jgi:hypothetical protein
MSCNQADFEHAISFMCGSYAKTLRLAPDMRLNLTNSLPEEIHMNMIQSTIASAFVTVSFVTASFADDTAKPVVPAPPVVAGQPAVVDASKPVVPAPPVVASQPTAADTAAKRRAANLHERNRKARAASGLPELPVSPDAPAPSTDPAVK